MFRSLSLRQLQCRLIAFRPFGESQRRNQRLRLERRSVRLQLEVLEERVMPTAFNIANGDVTGLINAINTANSDATADTINLASGGNYTLTNAYSSPFGPTGNGLPSITATNLTINGNGATIQRNTASETPQFRIFEIDGSANVNDLTIAGGNSSGLNGGGIYVGVGGTLNLSGSTVSGNNSASNGGGIAESGGTVNLSNSTVSGNSAGGNGGGVYGSGGILNLTNSTLSDNKAIIDGGGIYVSGIEVSSGLNMLNSTIAGNTAANGAGGITLLGITTTASIESSTIAFNQSSDSLPASGGVDFLGLTLNLVNSIVADNQNIFGGNDLASDGTVNASNTLIQNLAPGTVINGTNVNNIFGKDPLLKPLQNNGGDTQTLSIPTASPAFASGNPGLLPPGFTTDQRGTGFARVVNGQLDMGAFEVQAGQITSVSNVTLPFTSTDPAISLTATVATAEGVVNVGQVQFVVTNSSGLQLGQAVAASVHNGQASAVFDVPAEASLGAYTVTATYSDSADNYTSSSGTGTLTIVTSPTTVVVNNVSIVYGLFSEQETITAVVFNALGQTVNEGFVTFSDSGQTVTVPLVNSLATATLNIPLLSENPVAHSITVAYSASSGNFFDSTTLFTIEQTLMDFLMQITALLSIKPQAA